MTAPAPKKRSRFWLYVVILIVLVAAGIGAAFAMGWLPLSNGAAPIETGQVTSITAVSSTEGSGPIAAQQSASVFWKTTGSVAEVLAKPGAPVIRQCPPLKSAMRICSTTVS